MSNRDFAKTLIDSIPESKLLYVISYLQGASVPDEPPNAATADDIECHRLAVEEYERGETVRHEDIDWD